MKSKLTLFTALLLTPLATLYAAVVAYRLLIAKMTEEHTPPECGQ